MNTNNSTATATATATAPAETGNAIETPAARLEAIRKLPRFAWETEVAYRLARGVDTSGFPAVLTRLGGGHEVAIILWVNKIRSDLASLAAQAAEGGEVRVAKKPGKDGDVKFALSGAKGVTKESYATSINRLSKACKAFVELVGCPPSIAFDAMEKGMEFATLRNAAGEWIQSKLEKLALEGQQPAKADKPAK